MPVRHHCMHRPNYDTKMLINQMGYAAKDPQITALMVNDDDQRLE